MVLAIGLAALGGAVLALALEQRGGKPRPLAERTPVPVAAVSNRPPAAVALSSGWRYLGDTRNTGVSAGWASGSVPLSRGVPVSLPHDFNPTVSAPADRGAVAWYAVDFPGPAVSPGHSWSIHFESVRRHAEVWLNGLPLGSSSDPYAPFSLPARRLLPGRLNRLVVRVDNIRTRDPLPEDWWNWGGILGPVALVPVGRVTLSDLGVMPRLGCDFRCAGLLIQGMLHNNTGKALRPEIVVRAVSPRGAVTFARHAGPWLRPGGSAPLRFRMAVRGALALWSPSTPSLYGLDVQSDVARRIEQDDALHVGLRRVQVRRGSLFLNGRRLWLHGAAIHEDVGGRGAALTDGDIDTIVSQLRAVGANITRAHYLLSPRLLDALDAAGILVWAQPPVDHADAALRTRRGRSHALALLRSTLLGDRNHASVIVDSVGNELTPVPDSSPGTRNYLRYATALVRRLDPGIPVALDTYCYPGFPPQRSYAKLDVLGISSYFGWYPGLPGHSIAQFDQLEPFLRQAHVRYPHQALVVSEYGAEGLFDGSPATKGSYEFQSSYVRRTLKVLDRLRFMNGSIYWTLREFAVAPGWTGGAELPSGDTPDGIHHKGLISYDGTAKPVYAVAQQGFAANPAFARGSLTPARPGPRKTRRHARA